MRFLPAIIPGFVLLATLAARPDPPQAPPMQGKDTPRTVLVIHGGVGVMTAEEMKAAGLKVEEFEQVLAQSLQAGYSMMQGPGKTSLDGVEAAVRVLEDSELFNAGKGAAFTADGRVELDASIMEGRMEGQGEGKKDPRKRAGAVTGVTHVKNPISAARAVLEMPEGRHAMLAGVGAEEFALTEAIRNKYKIEKVSNLYFWTDRRLKQVRALYGKDVSLGAAAMERFGTVGAVALDKDNHIAAGTSTGGTTNKLTGRVGDTPIIGAGTYADDRACGVSGTGTGEVFIRHAAAHDVVARMLYAKSTVSEAATATIDAMPDEPGGVGGLIALDRHGRHAFAISKQCDGMYRGYVTANGAIYVAVFHEAEKRINLPAAK